MSDRRDTTPSDVPNDPSSDVPTDDGSDGPPTHPSKTEDASFAVQRRWRPREDASDGPDTDGPTAEAADVHDPAAEDRTPERDGGENGIGGDPSPLEFDEEAGREEVSQEGASTRSSGSSAADPSAAGTGVADGGAPNSDSSSPQTGPADTEDTAEDTEMSDGREADSAQPDPSETGAAGPREADRHREADTDEDTWADWLRENEQNPAEAGLQSGSDRDLYTDRRHTPAADRIEEEIQKQTDRRNRGDAKSDWTPDDLKDRKTAALFALLVSKVAEDISYQRAPGDRFWDPRKIMRRQIDRRPLSHCKMDYTKRRLALLVDTSPSCRDEAVFYSKIASGAMLRDDIDLLLCPNGRVDARFDRDEMRFVSDDRGTDWGLDGRTVLYFTDWDGADEIIEHARTCTLYWFDNCDPDAYWHSSHERRQQVRLQFRGRHFHCPDRESFLPLVRKIRP